MEDQSAVSSASQSGTLPGISPPLSSGHTSLTVDPPRSHGSSGSLKITTVALDGTNYLEWSRAAQHAIRSHQLYGLIDGTTMEPPRADPSWKKWDADNSLVVSWLLHSMSPQVYRSYMLLDSAYDIWSRARDTYSQAGSSMQIYELTRRVLELKQGTMTVAAYYSEFERLYQELDFFNTFTAACTADAIALQRDKDRFRIHVFLMGLNMEFDAVRLHVLHREPLPSLREAFGMLLSDENRRRTLGPTTDHSALAGISRGPPPVCSHCGKKGHIKDSCFRLHPHLAPAGRGSGTRGRGGHRGGGRFSGDRFQSSAHSTEVLEEPAGGLSVAELEAFRRMLRSHTESTPVASHAAVATSGLTSAHAVSSTPSEWIIDSGATDHMTGSASGFTSYTPLSGRDKVIAANGSLSAIAGKGTVSCSPDLSLSSVLHVPSFPRNLLSISHLTTSLNCSVTFFPNVCVFQDLATRRTLGSGRNVGGLYLLNHASPSALSSTKAPTLHDVRRWHQRLGHPSPLYLTKLFPAFTHVLCSFSCDACELSKHVRQKTRHLSVPSLQPFDVIHSDVWGPSRVTSLSGYKWFVTFIDCHSRTTWLYLLKQKSDVFPCFQNFHKMVSQQFGGTIRVLRSDNGGEYDDRGKFGAYLANHGILHQTTCVHTSTQNGVAERKNRHLLEVARCLLLAMHLPKSYWGDAVLTAAHLINRLPSRALSFDTPLSRLAQNHVVHTSHLPPRIFGSVCFVHVHTPHRDKLDARSLRCVFVGYSPTTKGYRCYHPPTHRYYCTVDVTFREGESYFGPRQGEISTDDETIESPLPIVVTSSPIVVTSSPSSAAAPIESSLPIVSTSAPPILYTYSRRPKTDEQGQSVDVSPVPVTASSPDSEDDLHIPLAQLFGKQGSTKYPIANYISYSHLSPAHKAFISSLSSIMIPKTWQEAIQVPEWKQAMEEELRALHKNNTWQLVDLPPGKRTVGSRWVFTVKQNQDGIVERYKARLVAQGYTQAQGIDYQDTFAPVAKMNTIRILFSCAVNRGWDLLQFDIKNAFLNGDLEEEVYMDTPPGLVIKGPEKKVCRVLKALYGLKQSPRAWFRRFYTFMLKLGYIQSQADHTLFVKRKGNLIAILIVYVDDIIITGDYLEEIIHLKKQLSREFEVKDLGKLRYFLGIEVARSEQGIFISQRKYTLDLLEETGMLGCSPADTPIEANHRIDADTSGEKVDALKYQRLVGRLIYLSHTRPDITYAVGVLSRYMHSPTIRHQQAAFRVLRYLKKAPGRGILFKNNQSPKVEVFTDADWAGSQDDRKSTTGYCTFVGGNLVSWKSKKQNVVARSSAEAEYRAMTQGVCEGLWLKAILRDIGLQVDNPITIYCDNKAAISIAHNPVQHDRTKHVEVDRHFIRDHLDKGNICTPFVNSFDQLADVFTKGLSSDNFNNNIDKLGMINIYFQLEGES
ncbi:hypothetical protein KSP39_PZI004596 [Platanthera zijinensis]|uniref:Polyprotein n=1 Tax=Platanthera zijinensis TaxID=2320716 RepID=A0AAP0BVH1_9ASPA